MTNVFHSTNQMGRLVGRATFFKPGPPAEVGHANKSLLDFVVKHVIGSVLDLGGGRGAYSLELQARGYDTTLGEIDLECLSSAANNGLKTINMNQSSIGEMSGCFDTVLLLEVLEHVDDFENFLNAAMKCARSRVLVTVPCNDDFDELFSAGLTYNHVAVSDHINQFVTNDFRKMLEKLGMPYSIETGDFLFGHAVLGTAIGKLRENILGWLAVLPLRALCKLGLAPKFWPSRIFVVIQVDTSELFAGRRED